MTGEQTSGLFRAMSEPGFYPHPVDAVEIRETHISKVFLTGRWVYKIKKPVDLGFLDFTTLEKRRQACRKEVELNRRLSEGVYLDVTPITLQDGVYALDGGGETVEYAVKMLQLPDERSMDPLLARGRVDSGLLEELAGRLAGFYGRAEPGGVLDAGSWDTIRANWEENFSQTEPVAGWLLDQRRFDVIRSAIHSFLSQKGPLFLAREEEGRIRDCHGDLKTGHVYFTDQGVQIIDCIEFNDRFRYSDSASDIAFLIMDMEAAGRPEEARTLLEHFLRHSGDCGLFALLDFYKCYRAFVRVKVHGLRLAQPGLDPRESAALRVQAQRYFNMAYQYAVGAATPRLWVVCGMPASGKSTMARRLGRALGVEVIRSDAVRKELFGDLDKAPEQTDFQEGHYSRQAASLVYGRMLLTAQERLEKDESVILDATFSSREDRREALRLGENTRARTIFVECACRDSVLKERLRARSGKKSLSDARISHFDGFKTRWEPLHEIPPDMLLRLDAEQPPEELVITVLTRAGHTPANPDAPLADE